MSFYRTLRLIAFVFFLPWFATLGCTSLTRVVEKPQVALESVGVQDATLQGATLVFNLQVLNPNSIPLKLDEVGYRLQLNGKPFTEGVLDKGIALPAKGNALVEVPVQVRFADLFPSVRQLLQAQATPYSLDGSVRSGLFRIPFSTSGEVRLSDFVK